MPETNFEYIEFKKAFDTGKTSIWFILKKNSIISLGQVKWFGLWRQYVFWPASSTIFSAGCLKDIQTFITQAMQERKRRLK